MQHDAPLSCYRRGEGYPIKKDRKGSGANLKKGIAILLLLAFLLPSGRAFADWREFYADVANGAVAERSIPQQAGSEWHDIYDVALAEGVTVARRADGKVLVAGPDEIRQRFADWTDVFLLEPADWEGYVIGYCADGTVLVECMYNADYSGAADLWSSRDFRSWRNVEKVILGYSFCLGLCYDGTVLCVCADDADSLSRSQAAQVVRWKNIRDLVTDGYSVIVGLQEDDTIVTTDREALQGQGGYWSGTWGDPSGWNNIVKLFDCEIGLYALRRDGVLLGMANRPSWNNVTEMFWASDSLFGLRRDGTVAADFSSYNSDDPRLIEVGSWTNIAQLSMDGAFRYLPVGLCRDGTVRVVTRGYMGEPYGFWDVSGWSNVIRVFSGTGYTIGLREDGTLLVTGGEFDTLDYLDELSSWSGVFSLYFPWGFEQDHIVGLLDDGSLIAAGDNSQGQCNVR